jgi:ribosomal protein L16 Arg81 hydroxylase
MYATPRSGQGFLQHADDHDVFIVQVHGTKEWHLASPTKELPLAVTNMFVTKVGPVESDLGTFTLEQGDVLYIPRGFFHEATTTGASSAHLTIGIHAFKWMDLVIETIKVAAEDHRFLREGLPPGFLDLPLASITAHAVDDIVASLQQESVIEAAKSRIQSKLLDYRKVVQRGHLQTLDGNPRINEDTVALRAPGRLCRVRVDGREVFIEFPGNFVAGPLSLKPMFDFVARHERFVVGDLPGDFSTADKVDLTRRLVSEGLISIEDPYNCNQEGGV